MSHLLKLADEYQAQGVLDLCVKCLKDVPKSEENVVKVLFLANHSVIAREDPRLDSVREGCYDLIKNMELADIRGKSDFKNLDRESLESVLVERTERLETFLKEIYPQFIGLVECCLWACMERDNSRSTITPCPQHFVGNKPGQDLLNRIQSCSVCRRMIQQLVSSTKKGKGHSTLPTQSGMIFGAAPCTTASSTGAFGTGQTFTHEHNYGGSFHFDDKIITIIQDFRNVFRL